MGHGRGEMATAVAFETTGKEKDNRDLGSCVIVIGDVTIYFVSPRIPVKVPHYTYLLLKLEASYFLNTMTFRNKP